MPARRRLDVVLDDEFVTGLRELSLAELRERRRLAEEEETEQSYVRRVLQGKFDLLRAELRVRAGEAHSLIESLPEVLADEGPRPQFGRLPRYFATGDHPWGRRDGDDLVTDDALSRLDDMPDDEIDALARELKDKEKGVSDMRRRLHEVIDALQSELTRRYASGEANVDELLSERE